MNCTYIYCPQFCGCAHRDDDGNPVTVFCGHTIDSHGNPMPRRVDSCPKGGRK